MPPQFYRTILLRPSWGMQSATRISTKISWCTFNWRYLEGESNYHLYLKNTKELCYSRVKISVWNLLQKHWTFDFYLKESVASTLCTKHQGSLLPCINFVVRGSCVHHAIQLIIQSCMKKSCLSPIPNNQFLEAPKVLYRDTHQGASLTCRLEAESGDESALRAEVAGDRVWHTPAISTMGGVKGEGNRIHQSFSTEPEPYSPFGAQFTQPPLLLYC